MAKYNKDLTKKFEVRLSVEQFKFIKTFNNGSELLRKYIDKLMEKENGK